MTGALDTQALASGPSQQECSSTTITTFSMADATENVTRYFTRTLEESTTAKPWECNVAQNITAVVLGYLALRFISNLANQIIDHVLLHNFPDLALRWCIVQEQGQRMSRLRRMQESALRTLAVATLLLRWPGWHILQFHLWECVRLAVALYVAAQTVLIGALWVLHAFIWTAECLAALTGWGPQRGRAAMQMVRFRADTLPATPPQKFSGPNMPRKHPSSVGMGRFLRDVRLGGVDIANTFVAKEWNSNRKEDETVVYHAITTREEFWDFSFEELKLQHYEDTGRFKYPDKIEAEEMSSESVGKVLPSWLSSRAFRESAFSCSTSSQRSDDSIAKLKNSFAAGDAGSPSVLASTPRLLTGEDMAVRRCT